jgi:hypothetical protein
MPPHTPMWNQDALTATLYGKAGSVECGGEAYRRQKLIRNGSPAHSPRTGYYFSDQESIRSLKCEIPRYQQRPKDGEEGKPLQCGRRGLRGPGLTCVWLHSQHYIDDSRAAILHVGEADAQAGMNFLADF